MRRNTIILMIAALAACAGCDLTARSYSPERDYEYRQFGERCASHVECESTYCMTYAQGDFCTKPCDEGCPDGWSCQQVSNPHGEGTVSLCTMHQQQLCMPCTQNEVCGSGNANWCLSLENGSFCAMDCTFQSCPTGYVCQDMTDANGMTGRQCVPASGRCTCDEDSIGQVRGCEIANEFGTCQGVEACGSALSWEACNARTPAAEICNGEDDNCDGFIDEGLDGAACTIENEFGACPGEQLCAGTSGLICFGQTPAAEACNGADDDCDGSIDEDFKNDAGLYNRKENCGACGQNCDMLMEHATATECRIADGQPVCRATACEPGYFLYMDGVTCMALPSNLCTTCSQDSDCIGPNSLCVDNGLESFCGRDCSAGSAYGPECPDGYLCSEVRRGQQQCIPRTNTCICNAENVESARTCHIDTCVGFEWCRLQTDGSYNWSECTIEHYNPEICDGLDNDCDGVIDEGMRDPKSGLYTSNEHCGYCFNDCSDYYKPEIHHTEGVCTVAAGVAACGMGPCMTETEGGITYEWVNTDHIAENGCECRRIKGNLTKDDPEIPDTYASGYEFIDENCDGIDGVIEDAIFVSKDAAPGGTGSIDAPFQKINDALKAWNGAKKYILVAEGVYEEDLVLPNGVVMYGGYSVNFKERDLVLHASQIKGVSADATIRATNLTTASLLSGFVIHGTNRPLSKGGTPSIAIWIQNTTQLTLRANEIIGGQGENGIEGSAGSAGNGSKEDSALNGGNGQNSMRKDGPCRGDSQSGGRAGVNAKCTSANASPGGQTVCPSYNWNNHEGNHAQYPDNTDNHGIGGYDSSFDHMSGPSCSHATESGYPTYIKNDVAEDGLFGATGSDGKAGSGAVNAYGSFRLGAWVAAPGAGSGGNAGHGVPGGGGGGGGGVAYYFQSESDCPLYEIGPSGGGGGAGGCGGAGGSGGTSGGASIGLLITNNRSTSALPTVQGNVFTRGRGGDGGQGGIGGVGGAGGNGGTGGVAGYWISTKAGRGGNGGSGGRGGGGGGGAGGPSFDILGFNVNSSALLDLNTFTYADSVARGGTGGAGGIGGAEENGKSGVNGASRRQIDLKSCSNSQRCSSGYTCNADSVCIPNQ